MPDTEDVLTWEDYCMIEDRIKRHNVAEEAEIDLRAEKYRFVTLGLVKLEDQEKSENALEHEESINSQVVHNLNHLWNLITVF